MTSNLISTTKLHMIPCLFGLFRPLFVHCEKNNRPLLHLLALPQVKRAVAPQNARPITAVPPIHPFRFYECHSKWRVVVYISCSIGHAPDRRCGRTHWRPPPPYGMSVGKSRKTRKSVGAWEGSAVGLVTHSLPSFLPVGLGVHQ